MKEFNAKKNILALLKKEPDIFLSGEEISSDLGFSRASVWKYIKKLREDGYGIEAVPHNGYKLDFVPDKIYGYDIAGIVETEVLGKGNIFHFDTILSTNNKAYELAEKGENEGVIVIAEEQTGGKGRMGRSWVSPRDGGMYLSIILRPGTPPDETASLTLIAAISVVKTVRKVAGIDPKIKWPNDVLCEKNKLCGILTEIKAQPDKVEFLVMGIGLNINTSKKDLPPFATSIKEECGRHIERAKVVSVFLEEFENSYMAFQKMGFGTLREEFREMSLVLGKPVRITQHNKEIRGTAMDIDDTGALLVRTEKDNIKRVFSGDVTI